MKYVGLIAVCAPLVTALWPIPSEYTSGNSTLWFSSDVTFNYNRAQQVGKFGVMENQELFLGGADMVQFQSSSVSQQIVSTAINRTTATILNQNFIPWKFNPRDSDYEPSTADQKFISTINLVQNAADPINATRNSDGTVDESYSLDLTADGELTITANSSIGLSHGLTTFSQLFFQHSQGGAYTTQAPVSINDSPLFVHRGLNMDVSRNYFAVVDIKRMLDAMAFVKMNRFHLHATDAQSWPLEIPALPELSAKGAYESNLVYSVSDLADIQNYGNLLGIETLVEIDMPGHTSSIAFSHPELIAAFNVQPDWNTYCAEPPCGTLKLNDSAVFTFLDTLLEDLLPRIGQYSTYFHSGGDEVNMNAYLLDETVKSNSSAVLQPLMQNFVNHVHSTIRANGLTPIVWEEMLLDWNLTLGSDVVVQTWLSDASVAQTTGLGHKALAGNYEYWYLDCGQGQWLDFYPSDAAEYWPFTDYCAPRKNWRLMYSYNPMQGVPANETQLVLGGEAHIWAEQTDPVNLDRMVWPRAGAAAEVLWSGAIDPATGQNRSQVTASPRLSELRERLVARGVMAEPIQMVFCTQNGTQCAM